MKRESFMNVEKFHKKFIQYVLENSLFKQNSKILVGFSGGADSTALMNTLLHFRKEYRLTIMAAHINYQLRGDDSHADERFVKEFCFDNNVPVLIHRADLKGQSGMENKAREIRLDFFYKIKKMNKIDVIALAHHKNDQAETVLSRFFRGSAFNGLAGIKAKAGDIIHPFLIFSREDLESYLNELKCNWRDDLTNYESDYNRNKIRNKMLPLIEQEFNPNFREKLIDYACIFSEADNYFKSVAQKLYKKAMIVAEESEIVFDLNEIVTINPVLQFYIFKSAWEKLSMLDRDFYYYHFKEIQNILTMEGSKEVSLPADIILQKDYYTLRLYNKKTYNPNPEFAFREISSLRTIFVFNDKRVLMQKLKSMPDKGFPKEKNCVVMDLDKIQFPLILRYRQPGDRFIPFGMKGFKKLKDFFIDEKIEKNQRDKVVIFCDTEKIIWIAEHRIDQRVAVEEETKKFVMFTIEDLKESKLALAKKKSKKG